MEKQSASGKFLAYQLQQSITKPRLQLRAMLRVGLPLPFRHCPLPTAITFLLGGRLRNPCWSSKEEMIFSCTGQMSFLLSPHDIWVLAGHEWSKAGGSNGKGLGVLCWNPNLLLPAQPPKSSPLIHLAGTLEGREAIVVIHCFLKTMDPTAAWAQPCSPAQCVDKEQVPPVFQSGWTGAVCRRFHG